MKKPAANGYGDRAETVVSEEPTLRLTELIVDACAEASGRDISVLDIGSISSLTDYFVIVTGRSDRQVQGIANKVIATLEALGYHPLSIEGMDQGQWVLVDFGDIVLHVFYEPVRSFYDIESLWRQAGKFEVIRSTADGRLQLRAA